MHEQSFLPTGTRRLTALRVPSFVKRMIPALILVLAFVLPPHYAFAEYDATFGRPPDLVVVPYIPYASPDTADAPVLTWIRDQANAGSTVLSICVGAKAVAGRA